MTDQVDEPVQLFKVRIDNLEILDMDSSVEPPKLRRWSWDALYLLHYQMAPVSFDVITLDDNKKVDYTSEEGWKDLMTWEKKAKEEFTELQAMAIDKLRENPVRWCAKHGHTRLITDLLSTECVPCTFYIMGKGRIRVCDPI